MPRRFEVTVHRGRAGALHEESAAAVAGHVGTGLIRVLDAVGTGRRPRQQPAVWPTSTRARRGARRASRWCAGAAGAGPSWSDRGAVSGSTCLIGRGDPRWDDDVGRAAWWVGDGWAAALGRDRDRRGSGVAGTAMRRRPWADRICFAGVGPGEVCVGVGKVVGVSQRRTRAGALFQCAALLDGDPTELLDVLALADDERRDAAQSLKATTYGLGPAAAGPLLDGLLTVLGAPLGEDLEHGAGGRP